MEKWRVFKENIYNKSIDICEKNAWYQHKGNKMAESRQSWKEDGKELSSIYSTNNRNFETPSNHRKKKI